jgi:hypothetical protein
MPILGKKGYENAIISFDNIGQLWKNVNPFVAGDRARPLAFAAEKSHTAFNVITIFLKKEITEKPVWPIW